MTSSRLDSWKAPGDVLLLSCYELGHQPLNLASPLGFLRRAGFQPEVLDLSVDTLDEARVRETKFVGISVPMHTALRLGAVVARRVRELNVSAHICFYGHYASLNQEYLLQESGLADTCLAGEFEESMVALVESLEEGVEVDRIPLLSGLSFKGVDGGAGLQRLDYPEVAREGLRELKDYAHLQVGEELFLAGAVEATRGCRYLCRHCPIPPVYDRRFFVIPRDVVLDDVSQLVEKGARHITFADPDFLNGPGHVLAVVKEMHERFPALTFDFTTKIEHLLKHASLLPRLKEAGAVFVVSAVESLSDRILGLLDKGHTRRDVCDALKITREAGIVLRPSLVAFTPWTTREDYLDLLDFIEMERLQGQIDPVQLAIRLLIPPGSLLEKEPSLSGILLPLDAANFVYPWVHPDPEMDELYRVISELVETETRAGRAPVEIFDRIAEVVRGKSESEAGPRRPEFADQSAPRLTESWFC